MTAVVARLLETFFEPTSNICDSGINVMLDGTLHVLFATIGFIVCDGDAHRQNLGVMGASGNLMCVFCQNCVGAKTDLDAVSARTVPSSNTNIRAYIQHTDQSLINNA
eukprot:7402844-Karenia_brevis.AAC.1